MLTTLKKIWNDERGFVNSAELILIATLAVLGLIVGLATFRDAVTQELADTGAAIGNVNQSYSVFVDSSVNMNPNIGPVLQSGGPTGTVDVSRNFHSVGVNGGVVRVRASFNNFLYEDEPDQGDGLPTTGTIPTAMLEFTDPEDEGTP